ncbi:MAG: RidA family protein [Acidobacteriota bacterium]|nr:RidA family protein [Acidobacteriota bacterium]
MAKLQVSKFTAATCLITILYFASSALPAQGRHAVNLTNESLPFSDGIIAGNTLYVSGTQGTDSHGKLENGISAQTRAALETIRKVVTKAGFKMSDVVAVNVYLSDIQDFAAMNKVYATFFPNPKPTRTTIQAAALVNGAKIEISAIAARK